MTGQLIIRPQFYPTVKGDAPMSYAVFFETEEVVDGLDHWQECEGVFVCYSWSREGANRAISEIEKQWKIFTT